MFVSVNIINTPAPPVVVVRLIFLTFDFFRSFSRKFPIKYERSNQQPRPRITNRRKAS